MEGEDEKSEDERSFSKASIPKRIAICVAGATVNIVFGILVYFILISSSGTYISNEIDSCIDGYSAQTAGLQSGDKIVEINGEKVKSKYDLDKIMEDANGDEIELKIQRNNENIDYKIKPTEVKTRITGMYLDDNCKIVTVEKDSVSEKSGIKANDVITKINGEETNKDTNKAVEMLQQKGLGTILLTIERGNEQLQIELEPEYRAKYYIGVNMKKAPDTFINRCINGWIETKEFLASILDNLKQLFTGNVGIDQMMGPVGISEVVAKTNGFQEFIYLMALISLSLGVTNLLPIPALDGGKILILIIEAIRRKPMKPENEINIQLLGFSILIALSLYVTYNDILRIL